MKHIQKKEGFIGLFKKDMSLCHGVMDVVAFVSAVGGGAGYLPRAPGTWGSFLGLIFGVLIFQGSLYWEGFARFVYYIVVLGLSVGWAYWSLKRVERLTGEHDDGRFVVDEIVGQGIACAFFEPHWVILTLSLVVFRILDIRKPGLIGYLDRQVAGAWGTLLDDVLAGVISGMFVLFCVFFYECIF